VPQIWLTYDELAALMDCDAATARGTAAAIGLDRRKCHDGCTRAKLNPSLMEVFLDRILGRYLQQEIDTCAADLRSMRDHMAARPAPASTIRRRAAS
jgi:hypothetical protein